MNKINQIKKQEQGQVVPTSNYQTEADALISQAINKNVSVETMQKLLDMRRELRAERAKEMYDRAMAKFQGECPAIKRTKEVRTNSNQLAYKYAPIESIVEQIKGPLRENGFSYATTMKLLENGVKVTVRVTHEAGHSEDTEMEVPFGNKTNIMSQSQVVAAAQTFAKRYAFCNAFGILTSDEDNDAAPQVQNRMPANITPKSTARPQSQPNGFGTAKKATEKQLTLIKELLAKKGKTEKGLAVSLKIKSLDEMTTVMASMAIDKLFLLPDKVSAKPAAPKKSEDVNPEEVEKGMEKAKEEEKKKFEAIQNKPAAPWMVAWMRTHIDDLIAFKIVHPDEKQSDFAFLTENEYKDLVNKYNEKKKK